MATRTERILQAAQAINSKTSSQIVTSSFSEKDLDEMPFDIEESGNFLSENNSDEITAVIDKTLLEQNFIIINDKNCLLGLNEFIMECETSGDAASFPVVTDPASNMIELGSCESFSKPTFTDADALTPNLEVTSHQDEVFHFATSSQLKNSTLKLVDYECSSDDYDKESEDTPQAEIKSNKQLFRRFESDKSFFSSQNSIEDPDFEFSDTDSRKNADEGEEVGLVGNSGLRKRKKTRKHVTKKAENNFGKGRTVNDIPCKTRCQHQCAENFTAIERHEIHEFYWGLGSYERQRNWLLTCVENVPIRRRVQTASESRRQNTFKYFINWNDRRLEVCQQFLLSTLDVSQMTLRYAVCNAVQKSAKPDGRGKHVPHNKTTDEVKQEVHKFIKKLPAVPSHYCRNKSARKYLPNELRNLSFLYRILLQHQAAEESNIKPSLRVFRDIFQKDFNLGFHQPKKDKCRTCECRKDKAFRETEVSKIAFEKHLQMKEQSKEAFLADQKKHLLDESYICASFDLQKVLNTPHGDNLLLYYSRKYSYYNETVYESGTRNGFCYLWGETDGNRGCSEVCTIIFKYLESVDQRAVKHVILYCDSCSGQNRNRAMLVMLHTFLQEFAKHLETIKIVFLLPGHTYMPVDSVHATIERFIKKRIVWAPSEWETIIANARINPKPFDVVRMQHSDFQNWKKVGDERIPSSTKTSNGQIFKISLLKQATFRKGKSSFEINYTYEDNTENMDVLLDKRNGMLKVLLLF